MLSYDFIVAHTSCGFYLNYCDMKYLHLILSILLLLCLLPMPYGYYMLIRFVSMMAFGVMAYQYIQRNEMGWAVTFGALALLFQPFIKIALSRTIWNVVDVIVAVLLVVLWVKERKGVSYL